MAISINVHKTLPGFRLSVAFETGADLVVVHGPSGAGKSLTLRLVAGLSRPDAGRVVVNGKTLFDSDAGIDVPLRHRNIGYVFQDYALFPHLSVRENVGFGMPRKLFGGPAPTDRLRIENLLENFGLAGISDLPVADISGGQQQRVALARALAPQPAVLLLDEPFSALDQPLRRQMRAEVKALQRQFGIPLLVVTHDIADVEALADEVIVVRDGRVDRTWSLRNICRRKKVARFVSDHGVPSVSGKGGNNHEF